MEQSFTLNMGLSEAEKHDLEIMIQDFQQTRGSQESGSDTARNDIEAIRKRMVHLTKMFLAMDRRVKSLHETACLLLEKSELLNQRIDTIIDSLRSGDPL